MDWYSIEFLYGEAFKLFIQKMFPNTGVVSLTTLNNYDVKKLFLFFDNEGIYLTIEKGDITSWYFTISLSNGTVICPLHVSKNSRIEIEIDGFHECFRILDKKLREKNDKQYH